MAASRKNPWLDCYLDPVGPKLQGLHKYQAARQVHWNKIYSLVEGQYVRMVQDLDCWLASLPQSSLGLDIPVVPQRRCLVCTPLPQERLHSDQSCHLLQVFSEITVKKMLSSGKEERFIDAVKEAAPVAQQKIGRPVIVRSWDLLPVYSHHISFFTTLSFTWWMSLIRSHKETHLL